LPLPRTGSGRRENFYIKEKGDGFMESALLELPVPGSEDFGGRMAAAYERYVNSKPAAVLNERIRPEGQDFFDWLMEDKESLKATSKIFENAGVAW
jgi:hypothetical protein